MAGEEDHQAFDDMDAILNDYDRSLDEILGTTDDTGRNNQRQQGTLDQPSEELGIDKEVKIQKSRKKAPKLDETL
jgi:hypothetical protein